LGFENRKIVLSGIGHYFPETIIDNSFYNDLDIGSDSQWIEERVGIKERRSVLSLEEIKALRRGEITREDLVRAGRIMPIEKMVKNAWLLATRRAGKQPYAIDTVILGTSIPDWHIPANACAVAASLGLECAAFDVNSACASFVVDLHVARALLLAKAAATVAVFNAERYTTGVNYTDRTSCILFGDAASAAILDTNPGARGLQLIDTIIDSSPAEYDKVQFPVGETFRQNGGAVQKFAITKSVETTQTILERNNLTPKDLRYLITHQANLLMLQNTYDRLGLTPEQRAFNVDTKGNQGACGAATVLSSVWDGLKPGDNVVVVVVGSGLTWGAALFRAC
jgi:3-oxoacyl-[acyl-carrier-protein] synthase-3